MKQFFEAEKIPAFRKVRRKKVKEFLEALPKYQEFAELCGIVIEKSD